MGLRQRGQCHKQPRQPGLPQRGQLPQPQDQRGFHNILAGCPPMGVLRKIRRVHRIAKRCHKPWHGHAIDRGFYRQRRGI